MLTKQHPTGRARPAPPCACRWLSGGPFDPISQPLTVDAGCKDVPGTWVVGTVRINTPFESFVYANVSASLDGIAAFRLPVR